MCHNDKEGAFKLEDEEMSAHSRNIRFENPVNGKTFIHEFQPFEGPGYYSVRAIGHVIFLPNTLEEIRAYFLSRHPENSTNSLGDRLINA